MDKRTITFEEMELAYYSRRPIDGKWYVTDMKIESAQALPLTPEPDPSKIQFEQGGLLIEFTVQQKEPQP